MIKIISENIEEIIKARKRLEKILNLKIINEEKEVIISGKPEDEYIGEKVIDAINFGFSIPIAISIKTQDNLLEILDIKNYTKRKDKKAIKARLIGTKGKTLKNLTELSNSHIEIKENRVAIIASPENLHSIQKAIISLIKGSKQKNVYVYLTKSLSKPITDLGLKE